MKALPFILAVVAAVCCSQARAYLPAPTSPYTITFDDIALGSDLSYYDSQYGIWMDPGWEVTESPETNVAVWRGDLNHFPSFTFGHDPADYPDTVFLPYTVRSVGAYFTTEPGILLRMTGYKRSATPVALASVDIGSAGEAWSRRYVEMTSEAGEIAWVVIEDVSFPDARHQFSMDYMTITLVPEPSSLLALAGGLMGLGGLALRRRRR